MPVKRCRRLIFVLGDQLDEHSAALADVDPATDIVLMAEVPEESNHVWSSKEGFVRQVLGWREFVRGVYWLDMPGIREANHFRHARKLPAWYWTGDTRMNCMKQAIGETLKQTRINCGARFRPYRTTPSKKGFLHEYRDYGRDRRHWLRPCAPP